MPNPADPRWSEIVQAWPTIRRWLTLLDNLLAECSQELGSENEDSPHLPSVERRNRRARRRSARPVEEIDLEQIDRQRLSDTFERYEAVKDKLERKQWAAVYLRFKEGLTQTEIARRMRLRHQSGVCALLKRAEHTLEEYERALREERFRLARKYVNQRENM